MPALTPEQRREALRNRHKRTHSQKDAGGFGSGIIDLTKAGDLKVQKYEPEYKKGNLIDLIPFIVTQDWYKDLRQPPDGSVTTGVNVGEPDYLMAIPVHKGVGPEKRQMLCIRSAFGNSCYICEERFAEMDKDEDEQDEQKIKDLKPSWRCFYTIFNYDEPDKDFQLWPDVSWWNWEKPMQEDLEIGDAETPIISDPVEGLSIEFTGKKKKLGKSEFMEGQAFEFLERQPYDDNVYDAAFPLDAMLTIPTYEDTRQAYLGMGGDSGGEETAPETAQGRTRTSSRDAGRSAQRPRSRSRQQPEKETPSADDDIPFDGGSERCPEGGTFGVHAGNIPGCEKCEEALFQECSDVADNIASNVPDPDPEPETTRTRTRPSRTRSNGAGRSRTRTSGRQRG